VSSKDLELRERLNRPVIKVMQRHPGNQMPEAQYIVQVRLSHVTSILSVFITVILTSACFVFRRSRAVSNQRS